ncbi:larval cuticle protein [Culex quinquefasciatus]|uniref:Larval cuticle protein n=1 Tax=Culex quinquefasciatus TaxID=7176 RepID=B0WZK7_CULQU|nr:larval cuticle protein [Culex quinquefasciatus]|eukprot:XP_001862829.1 larval cuticle protein [Culex quinquefasciatus]
MLIALRSLVVVAILGGEIVVQGVPTGDSSSQLKVVEQYNNLKDSGYEWGYELSDGRYATQDGYTKELPDGSEALVIRGSYSYTAPDGVKYTVEYYADETGYHPTIIGEESPSKPGYDQGLDPKVLASLLG